MLLLGTVLASIAGGLIWNNLAFAGIQDSRFRIGTDGASVDFDLRNAPCRGMMSRLFGGTRIEIKWINSSSADEPMSGRSSGSPASVAKQALGQMGLAMVYGHGGNSLRTIQAIVGFLRGEGSSARIAETAASMQPAENRNRAPRTEAAAVVSQLANHSQSSEPAPAGAEGSTPSSEFRPAGDATGILRAPPPGATAPMLQPIPGEHPALIPPPAGQTALPFRPAGGETPAPSSGPAQ
jgi:hypothetical protein